MTGQPLQLESRRFTGVDVGPHLLITAGVHGDEYLPMLAVRELIGRFDFDECLRGSLRGTLTLIPVVNESAFQRGHRYGEDGKDLARCCPGSDGGTETDRTAAALSREIQAADYYIDLHTGGRELCVLPLAGYVLHRDETIRRKQREMAEAFLLPFIWGTAGDLNGRSLSVARDAGVPAIYVEYLGAHCELAEIASGTISSGANDHPLVSGCLNVMRHLGLFESQKHEAEEQDIVEDWRSGSGHMQVCCPAPATGFLSVNVKLGQRVVPGEPLAEIISLCGDRRHSVVSEQAGTVVVLRDYPRVNEGDSVAVIAEPFGP